MVSMLSARMTTMLSWAYQKGVCWQWEQSCQWGMHCGKGCRKGYRTGYGLECVGMTACLVNGLSDIHGVCWRIFWALVPSALLLAHPPDPYLLTQGSIVGCDHCRYNMFVPWLHIYLAGGNNHICCSRTELLGHQHGWKMLLRSPW